MSSILVIDDEQPVLDFLGSFIRRMGFNALTAASGAEGIEVFRKEMPDVVFLDIILPDMPVEKVFSSLKSINGAVIIYFISGSDSELQRLHDLKLDAKGFFNKPVFVDEVRRILEDIDPSA